MPGYVYLVASLLADVRGIVCSAGLGAMPCVRIAVEHASDVPRVQSTLRAEGWQSYPVHTFSLGIIISATPLHAR